MPRERTDLHPAERSRRRAVGAVRGVVRGWAPQRRPSLDDVRDAVGDALAGAVAGGWATRPGAWWYLKHIALRTLRGSQRVRGGKVYASRGGATPAATEALASGERLLAPGDWLAERLVAGEVEDPRELADLDLLRWAGWTDADLARELGVTRRAVVVWRAGGPARAGHALALGDLARPLRERVCEDLFGRT